jgi:uncharacterized protein with beta-barrel porin domain
MLLAAISPGHAQAPPLGTLATGNWAVLAGSTVTNTGPSVIGTVATPVSLGVSPGTAIVGFGPGIVNGTIHANDAAAIQAQIDLTTAYNNLMGRPPTVDLTGQDLGGKTLVPGVYNFSSLAQLTGALTLNGLGNPNSIFIFNINSSLTTASGSSVLLVNGAQGGNVFWRVGTSATLGSTTAFAGNILANASITLVTGATITCGSALARTGAVTLDTNTITVCPLAAPTPGGPIIGPTGFPLLVSLLPPTATANEIAVATAIDGFVARGGTLPLAFLNLFTLTPGQLANALNQLSGEAGTGAQESGFQLMNSFLSLLTNPFAENRGLAPDNPPPNPLIYYKAPIYKAAAAAARDRRRWNVWGAAYGGQTNIAGDPTVGSNSLTARAAGFATGIDYRVTPDTVVGFALAGGGTSWGLAAGLGGGRSDVFQAGLYGLQQFGAGYLSGALAYGSYWASTNRTLAIGGLDTLTASYNAQNFGGRLEGGYRLTVWAPFSVIPYAAVQAQSFRTPNYSESGTLGPTDPFALSYTAQTGTVVRSELGSRFDQVFALPNRDSVVVFGRVAWAHDWQTDPDLTASFIGLPTATFVVDGAAPPSNLALLTAGAEWRWANGWSFMAKLDGELAQGYDSYAGTARVRYSW